MAGIIVLDMNGAAADRGDINDCRNDDPGNPNNNQYCYGFSQGYKDEANAK